MAAVPLTSEVIRRPNPAGAFVARLGLVACGLLVTRLAAADDLRFYIRQYRVEGAKLLKNLEIEEAVYPFLGPGRTPDDVEHARQSLEKAYRDKGFQTVAVGIPQQDPRRGVIRLQVAEGKVARLRVTGAKWFLPSRIKHEVPSVAEGTVPNLPQVTKEIIAVNRLADRRITPSLRPGIEPGTVDIDLNVEDALPLHGSLELNNRYSQDTTPLRLNGALSYGNFFQRGHTGGLNFQLAPENTDDSLVFSGYYLARVSDGVSLMLQGTKQDSDISTLGGAAVAGRGEILGIRAMLDLPTSPKFQQTFSFGLDYKDLNEDIVIGGDPIALPIKYYPLSAAYSASWMTDRSFTELNSSLCLNLRGLGSDTADYANKRYGSTGSFAIVRADLAHTHDLTGGARVFGKLQGQLANQPLVNSEQFAGGGLGSARGYLEATQLGDHGLFATAELRSPSLLGAAKATVAEVGKDPADEWRFHAFVDAGWVGIDDALPSQESSFGFSSVGLGTRFQLRKHYHGSLDVAVPLTEQPNADDHDVRVTFRGWLDF